MGAIHLKYTYNVYLHYALDIILQPSVMTLPAQLWQLPVYLSISFFFMYIFMYIYIYLLGIRIRTCKTSLKADKED